MAGVLSRLSARRVRRSLTFLVSITALAALALLPRARVHAAGSDVFWGQWGRTAQHDGFAPVTAQLGSAILANIVYDPFTDKEQNDPDGGGDLLVHYQSPLVSGVDVFVAIKGGTFSSIQQWQTQTWGERKYSWVEDRLTVAWEFATDWKPVPHSRQKDGPHWEPLFHGVLTDAALYVPGGGGGVWKVDRATGRVLAHINPFPALDPTIYTVGALSADADGNVYYNVVQLAGGAVDPWLADARGAWLVKISATDQARAVAWSTLVPGAPAATDRCVWQYGNESLPWPVLGANGAAAPAPTVACGSQRPALNTAPAIAADGTIYDVSRASFDDAYGYLVAIDKDLRPKWVSSMRNRFSDGCGTTTLPPTGTPGGCRAGAPVGIDPADGQPGSGRVLDDSTSAPVVAPDGSIYFGAYTRYNYSQGHLMRWSADGRFVASGAAGGFEFGWDTTPAIFRTTTPGGTPTFAVITKENHYSAGSYCNDVRICPPDRTSNNPAYPEAYFLTSLSPDLSVNWRWQNTNASSCRRTDEGLTCVADHPRGFEWCVNAPAVDAAGTVFANSEDGNLYAVDRNGGRLSTVFTQLALGAAYTPVAVGPDGRIYAQNDGRLFVIGF